MVTTLIPPLWTPPEHHRYGGDDVDQHHHDGVAPAMSRLRHGVHHHVDHPKGPQDPLSWGAY